jgi:hypothetical protein
LVPGINNDVLEWGGVKSLLILEFWGEVDAVVFADVTDGLRGKLLGFGGDAHRVEDVTTGCEITCKGSRRDIGQTSKFAFGDETVFIVEIYHFDRVTD